MLPDRVSNPGPLTYESGALPIALRGPAHEIWYKYRASSDGRLRTVTAPLLTELFPIKILVEKPCQLSDFGTL